MGCPPGTATLHCRNDTCQEPYTQSQRWKRAAAATQEHNSTYNSKADIGNSVQQLPYTDGNVNVLDMSADVHACVSSTAGLEKLKHM